MFCDKLRSLRQDGDLSQENLAMFLKTSQSTVAKYETGDREPSYELLIKIADYFNVSTDYLLDRTDIPTPYPPKHK